VPECRREGQITDVMIGPVTEVRLAEFLNKSGSRRCSYTPVLEICATTADGFEAVACIAPNAVTYYVDGTQVSPTVAASLISMGVIAGALWSISF